MREILDFDETNHLAQLFGEDVYEHPMEKAAELRKGATPENGGKNGAN